MSGEIHPPVEVSYAGEGVRIRSFLARPRSGGPFPAVITIHGIFGLNPPDLKLLERLAARGYLALAHGWQSRERDPADDWIIEDLRAAVRYLGENKAVDRNRMGLVGFCRGGTIAMLAAGRVAEIAATTVFYGQAVYEGAEPKKPVSAIDLVENIRAPILVFHGGKDTAYPVEGARRYRDRLKAAGKTYEFEEFPEAGHAYFFEGAPNYHPHASARSWERMTAFFDRHLKPA
ncbi:MAG: dienelactone hydrolase family protein [Candidatus Tectomicrobia bacterium]|nr:dienelactone hydrolase family protein [Candidatus Tectomicrobia bacterium]